MSSADTESAAFEATVRETMHDAGEDHIAERLARWPDGEYKDRSTGYAWWGYQQAARRAPSSSPVELPEPDARVTGLLGHFASFNAAPTVRKGDGVYFADTVRALLASAERVPEGWRMVPVDPTEEMIKAGRNYTTLAAGAYYAMLEAAPRPPAAHKEPTP